MHAQPESRVLIELGLPRLRVSSDLGGKQLTITFNLRRRGVSIDDRLHDSARAENGRWSKCQNVFRGTTLSFVSFGDRRAAGFELPDVMFENRFGNGNQSGDVVVRRT